MKSKGKIKLKVCGMRDQQNILDVAELNPDYMGFIFYEGSKRFVGNDFRLPGGFPVDINKTGVFVNESVDRVLHLADRHSLHFIQLHGEESAGHCKEFHKEGVGIIKAFRLDQEFDFERLKPYEDVVDYFLFDAKGAGFGGNGVAFDWTILKRYDQGVPFFLSGGVSPSNVNGVSALEGMNLYGLDVNSGVEQEVGIKDVDKIVKLKGII